jgi:hypothetical protein
VGFKGFIKNRSGTYGKKRDPLPLERLCLNVESSNFVILNPSLAVILSPSPVTLSETKGLDLWLRINSAKDLDVRLRVNSVKNLRQSISFKTEILRLTPQNDFATQPPRGEGR